MSSNPIGEGTVNVTVNYPESVARRMAQAALSLGLSRGELEKLIVLERLETGEPLRYSRMRPKDLACALQRAASRSVFVGVMGLVTLSGIADPDQLVRRRPHGVRPVAVRVCRANRKPGNRGDNAAADGEIWRAFA